MGVNLGFSRFWEILASSEVEGFHDFAQQIKSGVIESSDGLFSDSPDVSVAVGNMSCDRTAKELDGFEF